MTELKNFTVFLTHGVDWRMVVVVGENTLCKKGGGISGRVICPGGNVLQSKFHRGGVFHAVLRAAEQRFNQHRAVQTTDKRTDKQMNSTVA